jgi:hypothetical protein
MKRMAATSRKYSQDCGKEKDRSMSGSKHPSEIELALAKRMRKFAIASLTVLASGPGDVGASTSRAPRHLVQPFE